MFNAKALAAKSWMVLGKLLILAATSNAVAGDLNNPRFFDYRGGPLIDNAIVFSFGWFRTLSDAQKDSYSQSISHAVMFAENGQAVEWYKDDASGVTVPVMTWPTGSGYCRRIHIQAIAYNTEKTMSRTACYNNSSRNWRWFKE
jgi:surface antigen